MLIIIKYMYLHTIHRKYSPKHSARAAAQGSTAASEKTLPFQPSAAALPNGCHKRVARSAEGVLFPLSCHSVRRARARKEVEDSLARQILDRSKSHVSAMNPLFHFPPTFFSALAFCVLSPCHAAFLAPCHFGRAFSFLLPDFLVKIYPSAISCVPFSIIIFNFIGYKTPASAHESGACEDEGSIDRSECDKIRVSQKAPRRGERPLQRYVTVEIVAPRRSRRARHRHTSMPRRAQLGSFAMTPELGSAHSCAPARLPNDAPPQSYGLPCVSPRCHPATAAANQQDRDGAAAHKHESCGGGAACVGTRYRRSTPCYMTTLFREFMCFMYLTSLSSRGAAAAGFDRCSYSIFVPNKDPARGAFAGAS